MPIFVNIPYKMVEANIPRAVTLGIGFEIYLENNLLDSITMGDVTVLSKRLQDQTIPCTVHAPFMDLSPGGYDKQVRAITKDKLKRSVEIARLLLAGGVVCHPGYDKWRFDSDEQLWLDGSIETWTEVMAEAKDGPMVLLENIFEEVPSTLVTLFRYFGEKNLYFCFDTGHFNLFSTVPLEGWLMPLKGKLREIHLHDNHGASDEHLPVGEGTFPFRELKSFLKQAAGPIVYTSEVHQEAYAVQSIKNIKEFLS
jgi:sugar phosphate isomerase/epimerase